MKKKIISLLQVNKEFKFEYDLTEIDFDINKNV
jgi:hypothetical protein